VSRFLNSLVAEKLLYDKSSDQRGTWKLYAPLQYESDILWRVITVPVGFLTDFASVPRIPVAFLLMGNCAQEAAVIHDWLYSTHETTREQADAVFWEACLVLGLYEWRANLMHWGVRIGGAGPWEAAGQQQKPHVEQAITEAQREAA
jgi:hypothetical protein